MFTEYITTWAIKATFKNHDFYILILCIVWQIWASWYPKVPGQYGKHPLQDGPIQQSNQILQDGSWSGLVVFLIFIFMSEGNFVRCQIRTKQCASRLCTTLGSSLSKWVRLVFLSLCWWEVLSEHSVVSLQVNTTMLAPLLNGSCQSRYFIFFKFLRGTAVSHPSPKKGNFFRQNDRPIYFLQNQGDFKTGLHLILCYYATGDKDRMKKGFTQLVEIPLEVWSSLWWDSTVAFSGL